MDRLTDLQAMCTIDSTIESTPASDHKSLINLRKAFYMHFIIESVLSERVDLIPVSALRKTTS